MHAGLSRAAGRTIVTMDGDLQNRPEEIPRLVRAIEDGFDVASGKRISRQDPLLRTAPSRLLNGMLRRLTGIGISDFGCAFNAYRRDAIRPLLGVIGKQKFTKAVVVSTGASVTEVEVSHQAGGRPSHYSPLKLVRLALHVLVGFWPRPIQLIGLTLGIICTVGATAVGIYGIVFWIVDGDFPGPLLGGDAAIAILGVQGFILALIGEYLARMQRDIEGRPLYTIDRDLA
jgi:undecaprenyl-phosphate 4-deoxy-4-formamido-L-arabinose transferase